MKAHSFILQPGQRQPNKSKFFLLTTACCSVYWDIISKYNLGEQLDLKPTRTKFLFCSRWTKLLSVYKLNTRKGIPIHKSLWNRAYIQIKFRVWIRGPDGFFFFGKSRAQKYHASAPLSMTENLKLLWKCLSHKVPKNLNNLLDADFSDSSSTCIPVMCAVVWQSRPFRKFKIVAASPVSH